ncbi:MAG: LTA synthase family protein [Bacteroidota bacterium]|nr:LTA synthase family protein [Bacteroidota bacterium]
MKHFASFMVVFLSFIIVLRIYELTVAQFDQHIQEHIFRFMGSAFLSDLGFFLTAGACLFVILFLTALLSVKITKSLMLILFILLCVGHLLLVKYFSVVLNPLGADLYYYSFTEVRQTVSAATNLDMMIKLLLITALIVLLFVYLPRRIKTGIKLNVSLVSLCFLVFFLKGFTHASAHNFGSEYDNNLALNKSSFFYDATFAFLTHSSGENSSAMVANNKALTHNANDFKYQDAEHFAFLHPDNTQDVLSSFIRKGNKSPDYVFIIVEGLGRAFSNDNSYLRSFTPFLDSLSRHSLYWENCISTAGRTFEVLPSMLASLPYGTNGFAELGDQMPGYLGLINILQTSGYRSFFYYGGDSKFDNMNLFLKKQSINGIYDFHNFNGNYKKLPANAEGFSWGYGDAELFRFYMQEYEQTSKQPKINILLTVATHNPFLVNDQEKYNAMFEKRLQNLKLDAASIKEHRAYKPQFASVLYLDDALRHFFKSYASKPSFSNTVFIITGDHRMPDIPLSTKIDRYHVPLIVYSPLLKRPAKFSAVVSHLDITPSILAYQKKQYGTKTPALVTWLGAGLDTARYFRNASNYPLIPTKQGVSEYLSGNYMLSGNTLFKLSANMGLDPVNENDQQHKLQALLDLFVQKNRAMLAHKKLVPDSLLHKY